MAKAAGRLVHFVPQSRYYNQMHLAQVLGLAPELVSSRKLDGDSAASKALVRAIVSMRLVKQDCEIEAIDDACDLGIEMHAIAREGCRPGVLEQEIVGRRALPSRRAGACRSPQFSLRTVRLCTTTPITR